jgi:hypothetical protein
MDILQVLKYMGENADFQFDIMAWSDNNPDIVAQIQAMYVARKKEELYMTLANLKGQTDMVNKQLTELEAQQ